MLVINRNYNISYINIIKINNTNTHIININSINKNKIID